MRRGLPIQHLARLVGVAALLSALLVVPGCRPWPAGATVPRAMAPGPEAVVRDWVAALRFVPSTVGVNPTRGLAGLASWFWVDGERGTPYTGRVIIPATETTITIEVRLADVRWDFGDATTADGGLGEAYPAVSSVRHTYERRATYRVTAMLRYAVRWNVDFGAWRAGDPVDRVLLRDHRVAEIRNFLRFLPARRP